MVDGPEQVRRDELFLSLLGKEIDREFPSRWYVHTSLLLSIVLGLTFDARTCPKVQPWLYGYDAEKEVAAVLEELRPSRESDSRDPEYAFEPSRLLECIKGH